MFNGMTLAPAWLNWAVSSALNVPLSWLASCKGPPKVAGVRPRSGKQPDHDVARAGLLQGLHIHQSGPAACWAWTSLEDAPLEEVVAAAGDVVQRVPDRHPGPGGTVHQVAIAAAQGIVASIS